MKLSIIIPVYNTEKYLAQCLDSVIYPELSDYELIIVNDGSKDSSLEIAESYAARYPDFIHLISTPNGGLGHARNVGIEYSGAEYLLFLDSDDRMADNALPEIMETLRQDYDIFLYDFIFAHNDGSIIGVKPGCGKTGKLGLEEYPELLLALPSACNKICRRALFVDNGIQFPDRAWYEDIRTMPKLYLLTDSIFSTGSAWYIYYQREGSITNNASLIRNLEIIDAVDDLTAYYTAKGVYDKYKAELDYLRCFNQFLTSSARIATADSKNEMLSALKDDFIKKCPDYAANSYVKAMPLRHKLLCALMMRGHYSIAAFTLKINSWRKGGQKMVHDQTLKAKLAKKEEDSAAARLSSVKPGPISDGFIPGGDGQSSPIKLSIIIPVYNVAEYVGRCLETLLDPAKDSIARGLKPDYEIITINDGSTDNSAEIVQEYADRYPSLINLISTENQGQGHARNVGIDIARGEYIYFIDSDDYLADGALTEMMSVLDQDFDIFIFDSIVVNIDGHKLEHMPGSRKSENINLWDYPELLLEIPAVWNKIYRRGLFSDTGIRFTDRVWYEDLRTVPKLYHFTDKVIYTPKTWHRYLQRPGSVTNTKNIQRNLEIIPAVDDLIDFYTHTEEYEHLKEVLEYMAFHNQFLTTTVRANLADYRSEVQDELINDFLKKYPNFKSNSYVRNMNRKHKLLSSLLLGRKYLTVHIMMKLNNLLRNKKV